MIAQPASAPQPQPPPPMFASRRDFLYAALSAFLRVLWACRVSLVSLVLPSIVLIFAEQARDLFSYFAGPMVGTPTTPANMIQVELLTVAYWSGFSALTWLLWCTPIHFSARIILYDPYWLFAPGENPSDNDLRRFQVLYRPIVIWLPRVLGAAVYLSVAVACHLARGDIPDAAIVGDGDGDIYSESLAMLWILEIAFFMQAIMAFVYLIRLRGRRLPMAAPPLLAPNAPLPQRFHTAIGDPVQIARDIAQGRIWLVAVSLVLIILLVAPVAFTGKLYLALVFPIIAGAWVPLFTAIALRSQRHGIPWIAATFIVLGLLAYAFGDNHGVSRGDRAAAPRLDMAQAIARWKDANCKDGTRCPRPIIVATDGGASRAAFFTVTVLGQLMDETQGSVANQIFAISGVSGGSVGAAFFSAALANSKDGTEPCKPNPTSFWFHPGAPTGWKDCLQAMASEDFLSETMVALSFRDNLNFLGTLVGTVAWPDRARILEIDWNFALAKWLGSSEADGARDGQSVRAMAMQKFIGRSDNPAIIGLNQPFTAFGPNAAKEKSWQPLLVLNGTSATTGRRILTSHLAPISADRRIFEDAYDLYEITADRSEPDALKCPSSGGNDRDVTLASAATNSARFPIISPPGILRASINGCSTIVDRIVDGGYFENDGISTAIDIVRALKDAMLQPVVLHIANDPAAYPRAGSVIGAARISDDWRHQAPTLPRAPNRVFLSFLSIPIGGLYETRSARASYALSELEVLLADDDHFAELHVFGDPIGGIDGSKIGTDQATGCRSVPPPPPGSNFKAVSMSWWLSQPTQHYLDAQLGLARNCDAMNRIRKWLEIA